MKGLKIARRFFFEWGRPYIDQEFPHLAARIAAGRLLGSDVLGADDEISRDHNWGPQFSLFLSHEDYTAYGAHVYHAMNADAPNPWRGYRLAGGGDKSVNVESISQWFSQALGITEPPRTTEDWTALIQHEFLLYFIRHGALWIDGTGELSAWRKALHHYPDQVRFARLAKESFNVWHYGEYNFVQRIAARDDSLARAQCLGEFVGGVMRLLLLLHGDFAPYWKWLAFEFRKLPEATTYVPLLEHLVASQHIAEQVRLVQSVCSSVHTQLVESGVVSGIGGNPWLLPLLNDSIELEAKARNAQPEA